MVTTVENSDMKVKLQYSSNLDDFVFDPFPARDHLSFSKVSANTMLGRLLLSGGGDVMRIEEPIRVYDLVIDEDTLEILNDRYEAYDRTFELGQKVKAVKDGNTRLEALLLGISEGYAFEEIPYIALTKAQLADPIYMASLPIVLNQSSSKMGAFDTARSYKELMDALYERAKIEAQEENEDPVDDNEVLQAAKNEFLELVSDVSATVLETAIKLFEKSIDPSLEEALNNNQISLVNALKIVNKAKSLKQEQETIFDKSVEYALNRSNFITVEDSDGTQVNLPHPVDKDVDEALFYFANLLQESKAETKISSGEIELPEFLQTKFAAKEIPANTAQVLAGLAQDSNLEVGELYDKLMDTAVESLGDDFAPEKLTPQLAKKAKAALVKEKSKAEKDANKPPKEPKEPKEPKKSLEDMTAQEMRDEMEVKLMNLSSFDWDNYLLDLSDPDLAAQYKAVSSLYNKANKLKNKNEVVEEGEQPEVPFEEEEEEILEEEPATV